MILNLWNYFLFECNAETQIHSKDFSSCKYNNITEEQFVRACVQERNNESPCAPARACMSVRA